MDVDALFASMISQPFAKPTPVTATLPTTDGAPPESAAPVTQTSAAAASTLKSVPNPAQEDDTVTIHRTYTFAGKTHTETKVVPRSSAEARLYLESLPNGTPAPGASSSSPTQAKRTLKLARRSVFEPVPAVPLPVREDLKLGVGVIRERLTMPGKEDKGKKLNTVEKSKMDWAGYVDEEGLQEELEKAGKSKDSYLHRKDFLARGDQRKEEEARARRQREIAMAK